MIWSHISILCHFMIISNDFGKNTANFQILQEKNNPPFMIFVQKNPYSKLFLDRTFLIVNRFSNFLLHILGQTIKAPYSAMKTFCQRLNEIETRIVFLQKTDVSPLFVVRNNKMSLNEISN